MPYSGVAGSAASAMPDGSNPSPRLDLAVSPPPLRRRRPMTDLSKPTAASATGTPSPDAYHPEAVEAKWQARWAERGTNQPDLDGARRPFFNLMMFPYPSAEGL